MTIIPSHITYILPPNFFSVFIFPPPFIFPSLPRKAAGEISPLPPSLTASSPSQIQLSGSRTCMLAISLCLSFCLLNKTKRCFFRNFGGVAVQRSLNLRFSFKCSSRRIHMANNQNGDARGALIVLEGLDRSGKTSQSSRLISYLDGLGHPVESWRFPDRDTAVGKMISSYLSNQSQLDDRTIHLLFSANRWEKRSLMEAKLKSGTSLIVDRYSYSGVAFSSAKGLDINWCKAPEVGLLAPDLVVYLDIPPEKAAERGGYGGERYEKLEFQKNVAQYYKMLSDESWKIIDACQPMEDVEKQLKEVVLDSVTSCQKGKSLSQLWLS